MRSLTKKGVALNLKIRLVRTHGIADPVKYERAYESLIATRKTPTTIEQLDASIEYSQVVHKFLNNKHKSVWTTQLWVIKPEASTRWRKHSTSMLLIPLSGSADVYGVNTPESIPQTIENTSSPMFGSVSASPFDVFHGIRLGTLKDTDPAALDSQQWFRLQNTGGYFVALSVTALNTELTVDHLFDIFNVPVQTPV